MDPNPYQSYGTAPIPGYAPQQQRPTAVTVFGILNIVFGILGTCGTVASAGLMAISSAAQANAPPNPVTRIMAESKLYSLFNTLNLGLGLIAAIVLIVAGALLLKSNPLGRTLSIGYSIYAFISIVIGGFMFVVFLLLPLMKQLSELPPGPEKAGAIGGMVGGFVGLFIGAVYPSLLLFFMYRPNVVAALRPTN